ncbi:hypothetical protein OPQ81_007748 [Rhizoctonia solani]|nr:hypothetical protein OPQ81_007748 [Rhizoctonia solani]
MATSIRVTTLPPYEQVTSPAPSPAPPVTDSKRKQESRGLAPYGSQPLAGSSSGMSRQASQGAQPMAPAQVSSNVVEQAMSKVNQRDPLDPPPICFSRVIPAPSSEMTYQSLHQPLVIHAKPGKTYLDDAFVTTGTPALHRHDVWAEDWVRLLEDIHIVARLTAGQKITAGILPVTMHVGFTGFFISRAIEKGMKRKNVGNVMQLLQIWNERFFKPRHLEVILCRGDYRVAASSSDKVRLPAPDRPHARPRTMSHSNSSSSSSSSSSDSEDETIRRGLSKSERRQVKRERRAERREQRQTRREERRERKSHRREERAYRREEKRSKEPYRLVVTSV